MPFPLVHFRDHLFLYNKQGKNILSLTSDYIGGRYQSKPVKSVVIELDYQFQDQSSPSTTSITLHNLTKADASKFKKGDTVTICAGWMNSDWSQNNISQIFSSTISSVNPLYDSSGDWQMSISCQDGQKFDNETALSKIYKSESKSVRSDASESGNTSAERSALNNARARFQRIANSLKQSRQSATRNFHKLSSYLTSQTHTVAQKDKRITAWGKNQRAKVQSDYHTQKGKGSTAANKAIEAKKKSLEQQINSSEKSLKNSLASKRQSIANKRKGNENKHKATMARIRSASRRNTQQKKKSMAKIRTRYGAQRERNKRAKNNKKTKSRKQSTSGLHFKKGTKAKTIIQRLAKIGHIPIAYLKLVKNHTYTSGYTATRKPWQEIQNIAKNDCNSSIWWPHGELYIGNFAQHKQLDFTLTPDTGLMQTPEPQDDDDDSDDDSSTESKSQQKEDAIANPTTYDVNCVFLPFITTGSTFRITDPAEDLSTNRDHDESILKGSLFNDVVVVESGELSFSQGDYTSELTVVRKSDLQKKQNQSDNKKAEAAKKKAEKDKRRRKRTKARRAKRTARRKTAKPRARRPSRQRSASKRR